MQVLLKKLHAKAAKEFIKENCHIRKQQKMTNKKPVLSSAVMSAVACNPDFNGQ